MPLAMKWGDSIQSQDVKSKHAVGRESPIAGTLAAVLTAWIVVQRKK